MNRVLNKRISIFNRRSEPRVPPSCVISVLIHFHIGRILKWRLYFATIQSGQLFIRIHIIERGGALSPRTIRLHGVVLGDRDNLYIHFMMFTGLVCHLRKQNQLQS
jgi:hypothetical protein